MSLERFGFTATQSKVYLALLEMSPASGYALARGTGLARANVYGALEGLATRGAVARLPGRPARFAATEPGALLSRLEREAKSDLRLLGRQLAAVARGGGVAVTPAVEALGSTASVLERVTWCATGAESELVAVVGPWVSDIYADLAATEGRRWARVLSLGVPAPAGALVRPVSQGDLRAYWGGFPVAAVADRRRAVCAVLEGGGGAGAGKAASGIATEHPVLVRFLRHLLRRELAAPAR